MRGHLRLPTSLCMLIAIAGCDFFRVYAEGSSSQTTDYQDRKHLGFYRLAFDDFQGLNTDTMQRRAVEGPGRRALDVSSDRPQRALAGARSCIDASALWLLQPDGCRQQALRAARSVQIPDRACRGHRRALAAHPRAGGRQHRLQHLPRLPAPRRRWRGDGAGLDRRARQPHQPRALRDGGIQQQLGGQVQRAL